MSDENTASRVVWRIVRWICAAPLLCAIPLIAKLPQITESFNVTAELLGPFLTTLGGLLIAPELAILFSTGSGNIYWSGQYGYFRPNYSIPESLARKGKYHEAIKAYQHIVKRWPREIQPHTSLINIAVMGLNDGGLADVFYERGMKKLWRKRDRETLTKIYKGIKSRLNDHNAARESLHFEPQEKQASPPTPTFKWTGPKTKLKLE